MIHHRNLFPITTGTTAVSMFKTLILLLGTISTISFCAAYSLSFSSITNDSFTIATTLPNHSKRLKTSLRFHDTYIRRRSSSRNRHNQNHVAFVSGGGNTKLYASSSSMEEEATTMTTTNNNDNNDIMGGVETFEEWFRNCVDPKDILRSKKVQHFPFQNGQLRGLKCNNGNGDSTANILSVPRKYCLSTKFVNSKEDNQYWDVNLALLLLKECQLGSQSDLYGYCSLLCQGVQFSDKSCPPSTAPNALRHWTPDQKSTLQSCPEGKALLQLSESQMQSWVNKYKSCVNAKNNKEYGFISQELFLWAMEAVHSRAFRGDFLNNDGNNDNNPFGVGNIAGVAISVIAAGIGFSALWDTSNNNSDIIAGVCALVATTPTILSLLKNGGGNEGGNSVAMLPLIDSANHLEEADSDIEFDPLTNMINLSVGPKCFVKEKDEVQLYISYGKKSDEELLLNYGFLSGVVSKRQDAAAAVMVEENAVRKGLAEDYVRRTSKP